MPVSPNVLMIGAPWLLHAFAQVAKGHFTLGE